MSRYEMVLARQVPEPEWYPVGLFGACISRSPKQTDPICGKQDKKIVLTDSAVITHDVLPRFAQDIKQFLSL